MKISLFPIGILSLIILSGCTGQMGEIGGQTGPSIENLAPGQIESGFLSGDSIDQAIPPERVGSEAPYQALHETACQTSPEKLGRHFDLFKGDMKCDAYLAINIDPVFYNPDVASNLDSLTLCFLNILKVDGYALLSSIEFLQSTLARTKEVDICLLKKPVSDIRRDTSDVESEQETARISRHLSAIEVEKALVSENVRAGKSSSGRQIFDITDSDLLMEVGKYQAIFALFISKEEGGFESLINDFGNDDLINALEDREQLSLKNDMIAIGTSSYISNFFSGKATISMPDEWNTYINTTTFGFLSISTDFEGDFRFNEPPEKEIKIIMGSLGIKALCTDERLIVNGTELSREVGVSNPALIFNNYDVKSICSSPKTESSGITDSIINIRE